MKQRFIIPIAFLTLILLSGCPGGDYNGPKLGGGGTTTTVIDTTPPTVALTSPTSGATNVGTTATVSVSFSEPMNPFTVIAGTTFTLTAGGVPVSGTITWTSFSTAVFTYSGSLTPGTTYTATITTSVTDLSGNALAAPYTWSFTTAAAADTTPPTVASTNPANAATNVAVNTTITALFSEAINCGTVTTSTFTVTDGVTPVSGSISSCSGSTAIFTPSTNLANNTTYTATIAATVTDLAANAMTSPASWSFTTAAAADTTPPTVSSTTPANAAAGVAVTTTITAVFSEAVACGTVTATSFTMTDGVTPVSGTVACSGSTAVFTPSSSLASSTTYTATIAATVTDLAANAMTGPFSWSFTTAAAVDTTPPTVSSTTPANNATGVAITTTVTAVFSEAVACGTVTTGSFTMTDGVTPVAGTVTCSGSTAVFTPSSSLVTSTTYTATIAATVTDLAANAMTGPFSWSFTTAADTTPPTVSSTTPTDLATGVAVNTTIQAFFSEAVACGTVTAGSFTVTDSLLNPVAGTVTCSLSTAVFTPSVFLANNTTYTATIAATVTDLAGNALTGPFSWSFTTAPDTTPPTVSLTNPAGGDINVAATVAISAVFSEAVNCATVDVSSFTVIDNLSNPVSGAVTCSGSNATFTPSANLTLGMTYTATITTAVTDLAANALAANFVWSFTIVPDTTPPTVSSTTPASGDTGVAVTTTISAVFSEAVNCATVDGSSFTVVDNLANPVSGTVTCSGSNATFTPSSNLAGATTYTATITTVVTDLAGNAMTADSVWSFTTI